MISRVTSGGQRLSRLQRENQTLAKGENYLGGKMSFHTRRKNRVRNHTIKGLALAAGAFLVAVALSASANAGHAAQGFNGCVARRLPGALPGQVLWTYYETTEAFTLCNSTTADQRRLQRRRQRRQHHPFDQPEWRRRTANLAGAKEQEVCAMIYVFDDDEEMGECCGCPRARRSLATFSVRVST